MTGFTVDISGLQTLSKNLGSIEENINQALNQLTDNSSNTLGTDEINEVCQDFTNIWRGGLDQINEESVVIRERLDQAAALYREADVGVQKRLGAITNE